MTPQAPKSFGYSGTPLIRKLGIKPDTRIAFYSPPKGFRTLLGPLPKTIVTAKAGAVDFAILFVKSKSALATDFVPLRDRLESNTRVFRERMTAAGFEIRPGVHPIVPIMFSRFAPDDAPLAQRFARALLEEGIYVKGFFYPVVPKGQARIRVQISAAHRPEHIERAVAAFGKVGRSLGVVG